VDGAAAGYEVAGAVGGWVVSEWLVGVADEAGVVVDEWAGLVVSPAGCPLSVGVGEWEWVSGVFVSPEPGCADADADADGEGEDGVNIAGCVVAGEPVQAETVAETRTVKVAQLTAVSFAPPAVLRPVLRTFMKPP
jgi:hypothetical protein